MNETISSTNHTGKPEVGARIADAYHAISDKVQDSVHKVREFAAQAGDNLAAKATKAGETAGEVLEATKEKYAAGKEAGVEFIDELMVKARSISGSVGNYVRDNPGKSFVAAAVVGWLAVRGVRRSLRRS